MNYEKHYTLLIDRARERTMTGYVERHHVVPRCLGGGDEPENIVTLTPEEHYVAHQLLVKMHPGHHGLTWAMMNMTGSTKYTQRSNKIYGWVRRRFAVMLSETRTGTKHTPEAKEKMRSAKLGIKRGSYKTAASRNAGVPKSEAHRAALAKAKLGSKGNHQAPHDGDKSRFTRRDFQVRTLQELLERPTLMGMSKPQREQVKTWRLNHGLSPFPSVEPVPQHLLSA